MQLTGVVVMNKIIFAVTAVCIGIVNIGLYSSPALAKEIKNITHWQNGKTITKIEDTQSGTISVLHTTFVKGNNDLLPMLEFTFSKLQQTDSGMYISEDTCDVSNFSGEDQYHSEVWKINDQHIKLTVKCVIKNGNKVLVAHPKAWHPEHEQFVALFSKSATPISFQRLDYSNIKTEVSAKGFTKAWYAKRFEIVKDSADQGVANAQYALGYIYFYGDGVKQSDKNALRWIRKAAEQDQLEAQYMLGWLYYKGKGDTQSDTSAIKWWLKAVELNPEDPKINKTIAHFYIKNNQLNKAGPYAEKAYQLAGSRSGMDASIYAYTYGYYLLRSGKNKVALDVMASAYKVKGDDPSIALQYAETLIVNNQQTLAKKILSTITTENPNFISYKQELTEKAN